MPTLRMEVQVAQSTQKSMNSTHGQLNSLMQSLKGAVNNLRPNWEGKSATEFFGEYDEWAKSTSEYLEALDTLTKRLGKEIAEWEEMARELKR